ncbi:MAG: hypothetical protein RH859_02555 [Longimicrobiales bacterium]
MTGSTPSNTGPRARTHWFAMALAATAPLGCGPTTDADAPDDGPLEVAASDVRVLGTTPELAVVLDLEVLPDGRVWVINSAPPYFVGFDPDGTLIAAHGQEGGGPEEFRMPAGFVTGGLDGEAWTFDVRRHALIRVSAPDDAWRDVGLPRATLPPGTVQGGMDFMSPVVRTARLGSGVVVPHSTGTLQSGVFTLVESILKADLMRFDPATGTVDSILSLGTALDDPFVGFEAVAGGFPLWKRLWAVCGGDHLRVYDRVRNQLRGFDANGAELEPVALPPTGLEEVSAHDFARAVFLLRQAEATGGVGSRLSPEDSLRLINGMAAELSGEPSQLAAYLPAFVDFRCTEGGTMWLRPLDLDRGGLQGARAWLRVEPDGGTRRVTLPERFDPLRFTDDRVWGVLRDDFDVASVAWAPLPPT